MADEDLLLDFPQDIPLSQENFTYLYNEVLQAPFSQPMNIDSPDFGEIDYSVIKVEDELMCFEERKDEREADSFARSHVQKVTDQTEISSNVHSSFSFTTNHGPSSLPASQTWPGIYDFTVSFGPQEKNTKGVAWTYSEIKDKLYVGKDVPCPIRFSANSVLSKDTVIRTMALYTSPEQISEVVRRCINHSMEEISRGVMEAEHLVRCESSMAKYVVDSRTGCHSVIIPFENPPAGQVYSTYIYKFACFGSCSGGPNRRPLMLIFTLEKGEQVIGRKKLDVKICACPGRDRKTEESQYSVDKIALPTKRKKERPESESDAKSDASCSSKKIKSVSNRGSYTISVDDKDCYDFLKQMKKFFYINKIMKNLPSDVSSTLLHSYRKNNETL